ncbi:MAG: galactose mutarotase [Planctomyces sp.]|nr:galactose mutarotase [Planctomyces sp.]
MSDRAVRRPNSTRQADRTPDRTFCTLAAVPRGPRGRIAANRQPCKRRSRLMSVTVEKWGTTAGRDILLFTLDNGRGLKTTLTNLGAAIVDLFVPDRNGKSANVNVRHANATDYVENPSSLGAICGRFANRIAKGKFTLDGREYSLVVNNGPNHLHGGNVGFSKRVWSAASTAAGDGVTFRYRSLDGEENYPGNLDVAVTYRVTGENELVLDYEATTDAPTVLNVTNHAYFNLAGVDSGDVYSQQLQLFADRYLGFDKDVLVTGDIFPAAGTAYDFTSPRDIGLHIAETPGGYDLCYAINGWDATLRPAARAIDPKSGRVMEVLTTEPGVQLYTANHFNGTASSGGQPRHGAFCLECQHYPDSPNQPKFPTTVLRPGEAYRQTTVHRFSVQG